jgi:hypothetical protein
VVIESRPELETWPVAPEEPPEITLLRAAKERLLTLGWWQGMLGGIEGPNCLAGALNRIDRSNRAAKELLVGHMPITYTGSATPTMHIALWNDKPDRTFEEVLEVIDRAIESGLKERGANS